MQILSQNYVLHGVIMSVAVAVCLILMEITGNNQTFDGNKLFATVQFVVPFLIWFSGIRIYKKSLGGVMSWKQGFMEGLRISVVFAVVSPFVFLLYYLFVNTEILAYVRDAYSLAGASDTKVIVIDMVAQLISAVIFGSLYSALIAFVLKSKSS